MTIIYFLVNFVGCLFEFYIKYKHFLLSQFLTAFNDILILIINNYKYYSWDLLQDLNTGIVFILSSGCIVDKWFSTVLSMLSIFHVHLKTSEFNDLLALKTITRYNLHRFCEKQQNANALLIISKHLIRFPSNHLSYKPNPIFHLIPIDLI